MAFTEVTLALAGGIGEQVSFLGRGLAIASDGTIWAAYYKTVGANSQIFVAYSIDGGTTWTEEQVTADANNHRYPSIAIDSSDILHLSYNARGRAPWPLAWGVFYTQRVAGVWSAEETVSLLNTGGSIPDTTIAIDSLDNIHFLFGSKGYGVNSGQWNVQYRMRNAGGGYGAVQLITDVAAAQSTVSMAIDGADAVHIAWWGLGWGTHPARNQIMYGLGPGAWATEIVLDEDVDDEYPSIVVDSAGKPHVGWVNGAGALANRHLRYSNKVGAGWSDPLQIDVSGSVDLSPLTMSIDKTNDIHFIYTAMSLVPSGMLNEHYRKIQDGILQDQIQLTADAAQNQGWPSMLWATWPLIGTRRTNVLNFPKVVWRSFNDAIKFGYFPATSGLQGSILITKRIYRTLN